MDPRTKLRRALATYRRAKAGRDQAIREAAQAGMSRRAIAREVGLSHTRVQQILKDAEQAR